MIFLHVHLPYINNLRKRKSINNTEEIITAWNTVNLNVP